MNRLAVRIQRHWAGSAGHEAGQRQDGASASGRGGVSGGPAEGGAAVHPPVVRERGGGFTWYWLEGGEVRSREVAGDGTLPSAVPADLASGAPDLDAVERELRDASLGGGAGAASGMARQDAAEAGMPQVRQADAPAPADGEVVPHPAGTGEGEAGVFPLPVLRQGVPAA